MQNLDDSIKKGFSIDIYDNSPRPLQTKYDQHLTGFNSVTYTSDTTNRGISIAYNFALEKCLQNGEDWLLLLDQDTQITSNFIHRLVDTINSKLYGFETAAIVPYITNQDKDIMFPLTVSSGLGKIAPILSDQSGLLLKEVRSINSCTTVNTLFLKEHGGFNNNFPIDCLDHWLFHLIYLNGKKIFLIDEQIIHDLSISHKEYVSVDRYKNILKAESAFYRNHTNLIWNLHYKYELLRRAVKQLLYVNNKRIWIMTIRHIFNK